jgi:hypothetical protein
MALIPIHCFSSSVRKMELFHFLVVWSYLISLWGSFGEGSGKLSFMGLYGTFAKMVCP